MPDQQLAAPLEGVRVLAFEQLQSLPFATQMLGRLGADVIRVEPPGGESGRRSVPTVADPQGRPLGATFLRNAFAKRSLVLDLKADGATELVHQLARHVDIVAENFRPGVMDRLGLGFEAIHASAPRAVYLSVSGFGSTVDSPYRDIPAMAPIVEAMSGMYDMKSQPGRAPVVCPMGGVGDIGAGLFAVIGVLAALRQREATGRGQHVDIAMLDSTVAITDIVTNFYSMGLTGREIGASIMHAFAASDGFFVLHVGREEQFERLAAAIGHGEWLTDPRLETRQGWVDHLEDVIRPSIEQWAAGLTRREACDVLSAAGLVAGPCLTAAEVVDDEHLRRRDMLARFEPPDGVGPTVLTPGNPIRMSDMPHDHGRRPPYLGEHSGEVLAEILGLGSEQIATLVDRGVVHS